MKFFLIPLSVVVLFLSFCKRSTSTTLLVSSTPKFYVDLEKSIENLQTTQLSSFGKQIEYIPLETNPDCLIQRINLVSLCDSFIFVSDGTKLIQFNRNGIFVRQIGTQGRGPGEYTFIWDFCTDSNQGLIYVLNAGSRNVLVFNFRGTLIKNLELPFHKTQVVIKDTNSLMFHIPNRITRSGDTVYSWFITDRDGALLSSHINYLKRTNFPGFTVPLAPAFYNFNDNVHFMEYGIDTMYHFNKTKKEPYLIFNLGKLKMNPDPLLKSEASEEIFSEKIWIYSVIEDYSNFYINLNWGIPISPVSCVFNKLTSEVTFVKNNQMVNDLDFGIDFWPKKIFNDSILIDYTDAYQLLNKINNRKLAVDTSEERKKDIQLENLSKTLTETSNPVIMIVK